MKRKSVRGVGKLTNGRGPFVGKTRLGPLAVKIIVGKDLWHKRLGELPNSVTLSRLRPALAWSLAFHTPEEAETVGKVLEAIGNLTEEQLEAIGFVEGRREPLGN